MTGLKVLDSEGNGEGGVGLDSGHVSGALELGRRDVGLGSNDTHGGGVT